MVLDALKDKLKIGQSSSSSSKEFESDPSPIYRKKEDDEQYSSDSSSDWDTPVDEPITGALVKPGVVPQVTKAFRGAFFSPFARVWIPELETYGISRNDFVTYIDGLNESFVAHPIYQGVSIVGGVLQMAYGVEAAQLTGVGLQVAAGLASFATSYARTRAYVKATNKDLFHPAGLHVNVLTTKKMLKKIEFPEEKVKLPALESKEGILKPGMKPKEAARAAAAEDGGKDIQLRRLEAIEGYVMPFTTDVPDQIIPDNFFKKLGANQAKRMENKQNKRSTKRQTKVYKKQAKVERLESRREDRVAARDNLAESLDNRLEKQLSMIDDPAQREKVTREHEIDKSKALRKHERKVQKTERKIEKKKRKHEKKAKRLDKREDNNANKIRWLVIYKWEREVDSDEGSVESSSDDEE